MKHITMKQQAYYFSLCFVLLLLGAQAGFGQVTVNLMMNPRPSPYLSDWEQRHETVQLTVVSNDPYAETLTRFQASVSRNGQVVARTKQQSMPIVHLRRGENTFLAVNIFPVTAVEFVGNIDKSAQRLGRLPEGSYTICVQLTDIETGATIADAGCQSFSILDIMPPQLIAPGVPASPDLKPLDASEAFGNAPTLFTWTPVTHISESPRYILRLYPVEQGQHPNMVAKNTLPIYQQETVSPQLLLSLPQIVGGTARRILAWNVQSIDVAGRTVGSNNGISETFIIALADLNDAGAVQPEFNPKDSTKAERPPIPADRRTVPVEEIGKDSGTITPPKPELCGHKVREFVRREVGEWTRKEKIDSDMSLEKPLRPAAKTDITWTREIRTIYKAKTCVLPKGHAGAHKYGPEVEETDIKVVEETTTYWEGEDHVPPKDHWTDRLPR